MDFLDEDAKPRFLFQSKSQQLASQNSNPQPKSYNKTLISISISISILIFLITFFFFNFQPVNSLLFWVATSLAIGPFAPVSFTGGDIRVGQGEIVQFQEIHEQEKTQFKQAKKNPSSSNARNSSNNNIAKSQSGSDAVAFSAEKAKDSMKSAVVKPAAEIEKDWTEDDFELLKKQMLKHPVGMPKRWEVITGAFNGSHKMENVVKMAKSMSDKKLTDRDSFARFLKDRKPLDKRAESGTDEVVVNGGSVVSNGGSFVWSAEEDIALLNALKAFPKEVTMRWEKIAAAVPGKTKNACMKRVTELKKDFRSSKAAIDS